LKRPISALALMATLFASMLSLAYLVPSAQAGVASQALEVASEGGLVWLQSHQNPDGGWSHYYAGSRSVGYESGRVLTYLTLAGINPDEQFVSRAIHYTEEQLLQELANMKPSMYSVLEMMFGLASTGKTVRSSEALKHGCQWLTRVQLSDGSWESSYVNTAWAMACLMKSGNSKLQDTEIQKGLAYIFSRQNWDGGWGYDLAEGHIVMWLTLGGVVSTEDPRIQRAVDYLISRQHSDGSWSYQPSSVWHYVDLTSVCSIGYAMCGRSLENPSFQKALRFILSRQENDNGWRNVPWECEDIHATAPALGMLAIAITPESIPPPNEKPHFGEEFRKMYAAEHVPELLIWLIPLLQSGVLPFLVNFGIYIPPSLRPRVRRLFVHGLWKDTKPDINGQLKVNNVTVVKNVVNKEVLVFT